MTKIIDEDVQYKEETKFLSNATVAVFVAKKESVFTDSGSSVTVLTENAGKLCVVSDSPVITLPDAEEGLRLQFAFAGTGGAALVLCASGDYVCDSAGLSTTGFVIGNAGTIYTLIALDEDQWAISPAIPSAPQ